MSNRSANVQLAEAGAGIIWAGHNIEREVKVLENCGDKEVAGHWYCATHREHFQNNMQWWGHTERGKHQGVWICHAHGPEVP